MRGVEDFSPHNDLQTDGHLWVAPLGKVRVTTDRKSKMRDFHFPGRSPVLAANGVCATSHPLAAKTAIDILERGGNAMDAAIAGAVLLGICEPQMTGIGGDCFVLWSDGKSGEIKALNGSGRAPMASNADELRAQGLGKIAVDSPHSVTIPGAIDAFCYLSETVGTLGLEDVLARQSNTRIRVSPLQIALHLTGTATRQFCRDAPRNSTR